MLQRFCICLSLLIIGFHANVSGAEIVAPAPKALAEIVSPALLQHCGLDVAWQKHLFVKSDEKIDRMLVHGKYLLLLTNHNYLYCMDRNDGKLKFSIVIASRGLPVYGPSFYEKTMMFMVGSRLKVVDMEIGRIVETKDYGFIGGSAVFLPVRNENYFYVSGSNKRLYVVDAEEDILSFPVSSSDTAVINSIIADDSTLVFSTKTGDVVRIETDVAQKIWRFQVGGIAAPIVREGDWVYVSGLDRKLYKLNVKNGENGWLASVLMGEPLYDSARIGEKVIYQYAGVKGLQAVDKDSGKKIWQFKEGFDLLTENGSRAYALAKPSRLVVMDNVKGEKLYSVNFAGVSVHASNTEDTMIYVACEKGRVMSIKTVSN